MNEPTESQKLEDELRKLKEEEKLLEGSTRIKNIFSFK